MEADLGQVRSAISGMVWPGLPAGAGATLLAVLHQLDQTQWWTEGDLERHQFTQLQHSLRHAYENIPYHRGRLAAADYRPDRPVTPESLAALPIMTRGDVLTHGDALFSTKVPAEHGGITAGETSGSTGMPVHYRGTELTQFFWRAFTLRDHVWHCRDFSGKLAVIRPKMEDGEQQGWGPATDIVFTTGACVMMNVGRDEDVQLEWLARHRPVYLLTTADNLYNLARLSLKEGVRLPGLREARCYGAVVRADARDLVRAAWGVALVDMYSAEEVGYIALQCPDHNHYHLQSENLIVEILDAAGKPCRAGEIGRVVITTLHNFAMPLLRYEIGDYAEAGERCPCGRGLPVVRRIFGRSRNIMTLPDGRRRWPTYPSEKWSGIAPIRQLQMIQKTPTRIEVRVVMERALSPDETAKLVAVLQESLGYPFEMEVREVAEIPRSPSYKFEEFISEIT